MTRVGSAGRLAIGVAALAICATLASCSDGGNGDSDEPSGPKEDERGGTLNWAKPTEVLQLDPAFGDSYTDVQFFNTVYDTLVDVGEDGQPTPRLAESWEQTADDVYVVHLRDDVLFSNGRQMTADDVVGTLKRVVDPSIGSAWASRLDIKSVVAEGPDSVRVVLNDTNPGFVIALAHTDVSILPMKELEEGTFDPKKDVLGTGPFKVEDHVANKSWTLMRNPDYWGEEPDADTVDIQIVTEDSARIAALRNGTADITSFDDPDSANILQGAQQVGVETLDTQDYYRLDVNARGSVFDDAKIRQALALTIDRQKVIDVALGGVGQVTAASPVGFGVCDPSQLPLQGPDIEAARGLLEEAGAVGTPINFDANNSSATFTSIAEVMQESLEQAGFKVTISRPEFGSWIDDWFSGTPPKSDISLSYFGGYGDAAMVLPYFDVNDTPFAQGYSIDNPELNAVIDKAVHTPDGDERTTAILEACNTVAEDANVIPLVTKPIVVAYRQDQVTPVFVNPEPYGSALRNIASYLVD